MQNYELAYAKVQHFTSQNLSSVLREMSEFVQGWEDGPNMLLAISVGVDEEAAFGSIAYESVG